jgi:hypothetical protein
MLPFIVFIPKAAPAGTFWSYVHGLVAVGTRHGHTLKTACVHAYDAARPTRERAAAIDNQNPGHHFG